MRHKVCRVCSLEICSVPMNLRCPHIHIPAVAQAMVAVKGRLLTGAGDAPAHHSTNSKSAASAARWELRRARLNESHKHDELGASARFHDESNTTYPDDAAFPQRRCQKSHHPARELECRPAFQSRAHPAPRSGPPRRSSKPKRAPSTKTEAPVIHEQAGAFRHRRLLTRAPTPPHRPTSRWGHAQVVLMSGWLGEKRGGALRGGAGRA